MFRSATFQLTMWYLALAMTISLMFSVVLYQVATNEVARGLHTETQRIINRFPDFNNNPFFRQRESLDDSSHRILLRLISFNIAVLLAAGLASYALARRTLAPIEEAHEQQKRFTADVSHELRTPLTALKMESEVTLMNRQASKQELRKALESNLEEANKLETLINNLLRLTRLEADELQQNFQALNSSDVAAEALQQVKKQANNRKIQLDNRTKEAVLMGDQDSLTQLLVILLDNAIKYSPAGNTVTLASRQGDAYYTFVVKDSGVGIEKAALDHVFDRFYRADNARTKSHATEGFGLGLSIAKLIADLHNGLITIRSQVGKGTTVEVMLPEVKPKATNHQPV